jgi:hypothetical protein
MTRTLSEPERKREAAVITDVSRWPMWPHLPLKRPRDGGQWPELGIIRDTQPATVEPAVLQFPVQVHVGVNVFEPANKETKSLTYQTVEELLNDGWIVD